MSKKAQPTSRFHQERGLVRIEENRQASTIVWDCNVLDGFESDELSPKGMALKLRDDASDILFTAFQRTMRMMGEKSGMFEGSFFSGKIERVDSEVAPAMARVVETAIRNVLKEHGIKLPEAVRP